MSLGKDGFIHGSIFFQDLTKKHHYQRVKYLPLRQKLTSVSVTFNTKNYLINLRHTLKIL